MANNRQTKEESASLIAEILEIQARRKACCESLVKSLAHLPIEYQFYILTSNISVEDLETIAKFQDRQD